MSNFIFMLTHDDETVADAQRVFAEVRGTGLRYVGFKDVGLPLGRLSEVTRRAHDDGLEVMLEVVSLGEDDEARSMEAALELGVDWVLGGTHVDLGLAVLGDAGPRYCPFVGEVVGHPSELRGSPDALADAALEATSRAGVHGVDLLAYRHRSEDPIGLTRAIVDKSLGPVIVAGSIASGEQIAAVTAAGAWGFTIGSAIFEGRLPGAPDVAAQVRWTLRQAEAAAARAEVGASADTTIYESTKEGER